MKWPAGPLLAAASLSALIAVVFLMSEFMPHRVSLVRICPDGTRIWLYSNGRYGITDGWIENPETICR
jgi:hypothetical protein